MKFIQETSLDCLILPIATSGFLLKDHFDLLYLLDPEFMRQSAHWFGEKSVFYELKCKEVNSEYLKAVCCAAIMSNYFQCVDNSQVYGIFKIVKSYIYLKHFTVCAVPFIEKIMCHCSPDMMEKMIRDVIKFYSVWYIYDNKTYKIINCITINSKKSETGETYAKLVQ